MRQKAVPVTRRFDWRRTFPALTYPNYRLWFGGQVISLFGMWMQSTAQGYLVYQLTRSPAYLGYISFAFGVPMWLFTLYGGVVADRMPRRTLLLMTQASLMAVSASLSVLTFLGIIQPWHILLLAFASGTVQSFDAPARHAFVLEMVEREDLTNAIALNSTMFNLGTAVGPAVGGVIYAAVGPAWCFALTGISYTAILAALLRMRLKPQVIVRTRQSALFDLVEGLRFVLSHSVIRTLISLIGAMSLFAMSFTTLVPAWAVRILGGDSTTNGLLYSARGVGALLSALWIASLGRFNYKGRLLTVATFAMPVMLLIFSQVRWLPLSLLVLIGTGIAFMPIMNMVNSLVQTLVPDALRGRVMSIYSLIFMGMMPLGGLWIGATAQRFGEPTAVIIGASLALAVAALAWVFAPAVRALE